MKRIKIKKTNLKDFGLGMGNTLLSTFDENFVGLQMLSGPAFTTIGRLTRECNLDIIFLLQTDGILSARPNERGVMLSRNLKDLRSFIRLENNK